MGCGVHLGVPRIKSQFSNLILQKPEEALMRKWACAERVDWATLMWLRDSLHRLDLLVKAAGLTSGSASGKGIPASLWKVPAREAVGRLRRSENQSGNSISAAHFEPMFSPPPPSSQAGCPWMF